MVEIKFELECILVNTDLQRFPKCSKFIYLKIT